MLQLAWSTLSHLHYKLHRWGWYHGPHLGYKEPKNRKIIWMCLKSWAWTQMQDCAMFFPLPHTPWVQQTMKNVKLTLIWWCELWVWHPRFWDVPPSTHSMALGKSLNLGSVSLFLNWGMISGHLLGLQNEMIYVKVLYKLASAIRMYRETII